MYTILLEVCLKRQEEKDTIKLVRNYKNKDC